MAGCVGTGGQARSWVLTSWSSGETLGLEEALKISVHSLWRAFSNKVTSSPSHTVPGDEDFSACTNPSHSNHHTFLSEHPDPNKVPSYLAKLFIQLYHLECIPLGVEEVILWNQSAHFLCGRKWGQELRIRRCAERHFPFAASHIKHSMGSWPPLHITLIWEVLGITVFLLKLCSKHIQDLS